MKSAFVPLHSKAQEPKGNLLMFYLDCVNKPLELTQRRLHSYALPVLCYSNSRNFFYLLCSKTQHSHDALKGGSN
jgi:hypothetical protein